MRTQVAILLAAALGLGTVQAASAADLPRKAPPPPVVYAAPYNWAGLYMGLNIGYGWGTDSDPDVTYSDGSAIGVAGYFAAGGNVMPNVRPKGVIGGLQVGYNWMVSPNFVAGVIADFQGSDMKEYALASVDPPGGPVLTHQSNEVRIEWFGTLRGKLGYAMNNWLLYATGGLAYGNVESTGWFTAPTLGLSYSGSDSSTQFGWAVGAGFDYGFTRNWVVGLEYLYIDLGNTSYTMTSTNGVSAATTFTVSNSVNAHIARLNLNYRF